MTNNSPNNNIKVLVGLSGGVDSAVSALLLKQQGYNVEALFMKNWEEDDNALNVCTASIDLDSATAVCEHLNIKLHKANFAAEYWDNVFEHFLAEYRSGRTPNPDILCNREIKFKYFLEYVKLLGADYIATGHYAKIKDSKLLKPKDLNKDQTYFLYAINPTALDKVIFPLENYTKPEVRALAEQYNLPNAKRKDSTGVCFISPNKFNQFLTTYLPAQPGDIYTIDNKWLGKHNGLIYYTIGQRQGLGIGGHKDYSLEPWFVVDKDLDNNKLIVAQGHDHPSLYKQSLIASQMSWLNFDPPKIIQCSAKIRYRQTEQLCTVTRVNSEQYQVEFVTPQRAVTPGQSIVLYQNDICLGGGIIE